MAKETESSATSPPEVILYDDFDDDILTESFHSRSRCCSLLSCFGSHPSPARCGSSSSLSVWERLQQTAEAEPNKWWVVGPFMGLKKAREWSEIIAGPKWKTFIRRFNKGFGGKFKPSAGSKFHYDPLSYSLNFDDGRGYNGHLDGAEDDGFYPDFSSRFASRPNSCKSSMDMGKNGFPFSCNSSMDLGNNGFPRSCKSSMDLGNNEIVA